MPSLPPTFLKSTLYTNELFGNIFVQGNIKSGSITANVIYGNVVGSNIVANTIYGNVSATNIVAQNIYGNLTSNTWTPGNVTNLNITGNMTAGYFIGNGSQLTGIATSTLPDNANIDIAGNVIGAYANVITLIGTTGNIGNVRMVGGNVAVSGQVNALGNVSAEYFLGNGALLSGIEQYVLPSEITADVLGNVTATGNVSAEYLLGNGALLTGIEQYVLPSEITTDVLGNVTATGNIEAALFIGNGALLTGIEQYVLPSEITADVLGNVTATGNVEAALFIGNGSLLTGIEQYVLPSEITADVFGNVTATGNVSAEYLLGNGSLLSGIEQYVLPGSANIDITGNVIGAYANVATLIGTTGNVGNVRMTGGNIDVSGQVNALGNVVAPFFVGNGSLLTGILSSSPLPARYLSAGRTTNQTSAGSWANVNIIMDTVRASSGITYNTSTGVFTLEGGVTYRITAQINFESLASYAFTFRLVNNTTGAQIGPFAESFSMSSGSGGGGGGGGGGTSNPSAPVLDIIVTPTTTTDYRLRMATSTTANSGETLRADTGTFLTIVGLGSGFTSGLPSTGNIDISGNVIGAYANVITLIGTTGNLGNVRMVGGNVAVSGQINTLGNVMASYFIVH